MIEPGTAAPDFTGPDETGTTVTLRELRAAPVVLHFFALAWTGV